MQPDVEETPEDTAEVNKGDILDYTSRRYTMLKVAFFFLITWYIAGSLFPQHKVLVVMMRYNGALLTTYLAFASGLLTHLRYRDFVVRAHGRFWSTGNPFMYKYIFCRVLRFAPIFYLVLFYAILLQGAKALLASTITIGDGKTIRQFETPMPGVFQVLAASTLTSSWFNLQPFGPIHAHQLTPLFAPFTIMASLLVSCWLLYPTIAKCLVRVTRDSKALTIGLLVVLTALTEAGFTTFSLLTAGKLNRIQQLNTRRLEMVTGSQNEYLNIGFKLPMFVLGVVTCEAAYKLGWCTSPKVGAEDDETTPAPEHSVFERWVYPYLSDALIVMVTLYSVYDPKAHAKSSWRGRLTSFGFRSKWSFESWIVMSQFGVLKLLVPAALFSLSPKIDRSIVSKLFCLDPLVYVLPGRTGLIMSLIYVPYVFTTPDDWAAAVQSGSGFFLFCCMVFLISLSLYYYVFEPLNLWLTLQVAKMLEVDPTAGEAPKILASPHYDRLNLKDDEQELAAYKHLASVSRPQQASELPRWFKQVFIDVHAFSD